MYQLLSQHCDAVISELRRIDDLSKYLRLRALLLSKEVEVGSDTEFQRSYRNYWRMNVARLGERFYARYFQVLAQCRESGDVDIESIVRMISKTEGAESQSLQFSFATKLAHMVDPRLPVYDSFVAAFYFYAAPASDRPFEERLHALLAFYAFLQAEYSRIIANDLLAVPLRQFRSAFQVGRALADERIIDWLIWGWVSLLRGGAQQRRNMLYE